MRGVSFSSNSTGPKPHEKLQALWSCLVGTYLCSRYLLTLVNKGTIQCITS